MTLIRDKTGHYLGSSVVVFDNLVDPAILEAHACCEALALAQDLNIQRLVVTSNCRGQYKHQEWSFAFICTSS